MVITLHYLQTAHFYVPVISNKSKNNVQINKNMEIIFLTKKEQSKNIDFLVPVSQNLIDKFLFCLSKLGQGIKADSPKILRLTRF
jgi:hypothetical protein